jgi:hypothetical protein
MFLLFLLGNLLLFAYARGYIGPMQSGEASRLASQLEADKIRVVGTGPATAVAPQAPATPAPPPEACRLLSALTREQANRIDSMAKTREPPLRLTESALEGPSSWWVFVPPQPDRKAVDERVAELKRAGLSDFFVIADEGPNRYSISLGVFKTEGAANEFRQALGKKGVQNTRVAPRLAQDAKRAVQVRGAQDAVDGLFKELTAELGELQIGNCPAGR